MNIVFLDEATVGKIPALELIKQLGTYTAYDFTPVEEKISRLKGADIAIINKVIIDREVMDSCPELKLICITATGMNNVDLEAAKEKGIVVKNVADYSTDSVVQTTFALLLELMNRVSVFNDYIYSGEYSKSNSFTLLTPSFNELSGKRYGIIGLGNIGRKVAAAATAFGAEVCYYSTSGMNNNSDYQQVSLDELLSTSDVVSIHAPLNEKTLGLIDSARLSQMKESALLINVGRGGIVVEEDLVNALNGNVIAGAGIDVFTTEPLPATNPLFKIENKEKLILTPHIAWASLEARERLIKKVAENISNFMNI